MKKRPQKTKRYRKDDFIIPGCGTGVKVPDGSSYALEKALRVYKRNMKEFGTLAEFKERRYHAKPSHVKRVKMKDAIRRQTRWQQQQDAYWAKHCWTVMFESGPA